MFATLRDPPIGTRRANPFREGRAFQCLAVSLAIATSASRLDAAEHAAGQPRVYGADDRKEYFEVTDPRGRSTMSEAIVVLVPRARVGADVRASLATAPSWGDAEGLCP